MSRRLRLVGYGKRHIDTGQHRLRISKIGVENGFVPVPAFRPHRGGIIELGGSDLVVQHADQVRAEPLRAIVRVAKGALLAEQRPSAGRIAALGIRPSPATMEKSQRSELPEAYSWTSHPLAAGREKWATAPDWRLRAPAFAELAKQTFRFGEKALQKQ